MDFLRNHQDFPLSIGEISESTPTLHRPGRGGKNRKPAGESRHLTRQQRIRALKVSGKFAEAEREIGDGLREDPDNLLLKTSLADLFLRQERLAEARILAEEVLARDPGHPQALSVLGDFFLKDHAPGQALEFYRQAFSRDPRPYLILKTARSLREMGRLAEALEELEKILVVQRENILFLREKALTLNRLKKFDQALACYEKISALRPDDAFSRKEILRLRSRTRPDVQVLKELETVAGMDSKKDDPHLRGLLAQKLKDAGMVREALAEYGAARALDPGSLYFLKQQGFCHYRLEEHDQAIQCLGEAFRRDPKDAVVRKTLEKSFEAKGDFGGFLFLLEETLHRHPHERYLLGVIRKLRRKMELRPSEEAG
jgi:tetratricopeptide (TPR) repeat protein